MSDILVRVVTIDEVLPHPNADKLEIIKVGGWQIVSGKGNCKVGETAVHVPPDAMVPKALADEWSVTPYLSWRANAAKGRVKAVRLRGVPSHGFLAPNSLGAEVGNDLADRLGIEKYEEPVPIGMQAGQMARNHPLFHTYTKIQNLRDYRDQLNYSVPLVVTEKIHGTNSRVGWVREQTVDGGNWLEKAIGTHQTQRKNEDAGQYGMPFERHGEALDKLLALIQTSIPVNSLIVFGEIYGTGVQDLHYGAKTEKGYRVFDIAVNGEYMNWSAMAHFCQQVGLPTVPVLATGVLDFGQLIELAQGQTTLDDKHIREGIVVRPMMQELPWGRGEYDPNPKRMIFKLVSDDYLTRKNGTEHH